jgi:hypothetical protein
MDDMRLGAARPQPPGQPEAIPAGLEGDRDARYRAARRDSSSASGASFFTGWRSIPGTMPPTNQLAWLISITAISVLSWSRAVRDRSDH